MQGMNESPMESRKAQARAWFENLQDQIIAAFEALECRDYGRVDLRVDASGQPYVIDINPNCDRSNC